MNRDGLIRALRRYANKRGLHFAVDRRKGNGSHYRVELGDKWTIVQHELNPLRIRLIARQLGIDPGDL
jgi:hypothetical protein